MRCRLASFTLALSVSVVGCSEGDLVVTPAAGPSAGTGKAGSSGSAGASSGSSGSGTSGTAGAAGTSTAKGPTFAGVGLVPGVTNDLCGRVTVELDADATVEITFTDDTGHTVKATSSTAAKKHAVPFFGLHAARSYKAVVKAKSTSGESSATPLVHATKALPADFPPIEAVVSDKTKPGVTLFPVSRFGAQGVDQTYGYVVAVDGGGEVVWYVPTGRDLADARIASNGNLRVIVGHDGLAEIHLIDGGVSAVIATKLSKDPLLPGTVGANIDTVHHDAVESGPGRVLALSTVAKVVPKSACPATYDKDYEVVGDTVDELDLATGAVLSSVSLFDLIDPCRRVDTAFKSQFWVPLYGTGAADWTHANAVFFDEPRGEVLVSLRHQDWVVAYDRATGKLAWRLGAEGDFALQGEGASWPYHQHSSKVLSNGNVMLYDNATTRPGTDDTQIDKLPASRAVEYKLDRSGAKGTWTATQVWSFGEGDVRTTDAATGAKVPWYSSVVGDADVTATDTALVTHGAVTDPPNGQIFLTEVRKFARIVEVTRDASAKVVLDLRVRDPQATGFQSYLVFRAQRHQGLQTP